MYMCVRRSELTFVFLLDFRTILTVWYHFLLFLFQQFCVRVGILSTRAKHLHDSIISLRGVI